MLSTVPARCLMAALAIWFAWQPAVVAKQGSADRKPAEMFLPKTTAELGEIPRGKNMSVEFVIENRGQAQLQITAKANCGCTLIEYDKLILPGEQGKIATEFSSSGMRGDFHKTIDVQTNDPKHANVQLVLTGRVIETVELDPKVVPKLTLKLDGPTEQELTLRTLPNVAVTGATCEDAYVQAEVEPAGEQSYRLRISVDKDAPFGRSNFTLMIATTSEFEPAVPITVHYEKGIIVTPPSFVFNSGRHAADGALRSTVLLRKREGEFQVRSAVSEIPNLEFEIVPLKAGELYRVTAIYRGELSALSGEQTVTIETDDAQQQQLQLAVSTSQ